MNSLFKRAVNRAVSNTNALSRIQRASFSLAQLEVDQKSAEIPDHRSDHEFASILNAVSVQEIQNALQGYKSDIRTRPKRDSTHLLQLLDEIASHKFDDENENETETESEKHSENTEQEQAATKHMNRPSVIRAYRLAIEKCTELKEFDEGHKLFEETKQNKLLSPNTFASAMKLIMAENPCKESLKKCVQLRSEMQSTYNLKPSGKVYAVLLSNAMRFNQIRKAESLIKEILSMEESAKLRLLREKNLRFFILKFYSDRKRIHDAITFMSQLVDTMGESAVDDYMFAAILKGVALCVEDGDASMVDVGEAIFKKSFDILGRTPSAAVFNSCMNVYANVPDYQSCLDVMQSMLDTTQFAKPTAATFGVCLKSLALYGENKQAFEYEQGWKLVQQVLDTMKQRNVQPHLHIYATLFNLCSGGFCGRPDIDRLYKYYEEMNAQNVKLTEQAALNLVLSGLCYFQYEMEKNDGKNVHFMKEECGKFKDWAVSQWEAHNLTLAERHHQLIDDKWRDVVGAESEKENENEIGMQETV